MNRLVGIAALTLGVALAVAGRAEARPAAACPASFVRASATPACKPDGSPTCSYPEGRCTCAAPSPCSGVPQPPGPPRWICRAKRTDGCPEAAPPQNGTCRTPGKTCSYGTCGSLAYTCAASTRRWAITGGTAPPPSATGGAARAVPPPPAWKQCAPGLRFECHPRSQGIAPAQGETIPDVCGCIPPCPELVSLEAEGRWPDGSRKGRFQCTTGGGIPSAAPPRGP